MAGRVVEVVGGGAVPGGAFAGTVVAVERREGLVLVGVLGGRRDPDGVAGGTPGVAGWPAPGSPTA